MHYPIVGLVLSGGRSTRMQTDKGLMVYQGKLWAARAAEKLSSLGIVVRISINKDQFSTYKNHFDPTWLLVDDTEIPGPLGGLITAHNKFPEADIFLLACDLIMISGALLQILFESCSGKNARSHLNCAFKLNGMIEPVAAIYSCSRLKKIAQLSKSGDLISFSLKDILNCEDTRYISLPERNTFELKNYNSPEDFSSIHGQIEKK